jgi:hypothetical protein
MNKTGADTAFSARLISRAVSVTGFMLGSLLSQPEGIDEPGPTYGKNRKEQDVYLPGIEVKKSDDDFLKTSASSYS